MQIIRRSVDDRGRVVLPLRGVKEVFLTRLGDVILISSDKETLEKFAKFVEEFKRWRKLQILREWFDLIEKSGLSRLTPEDIDRLVARSMLRELK